MPLHDLYGKFWHICLQIIRRYRNGGCPGGRAGPKKSVRNFPMIFTRQKIRIKTEKPSLLQCENRDRDLRFSHLFETLPIKSVRLFYVKKKIISSSSLRPSLLPLLSLPAS
jgi:hypothetical protein